MRNTIKRFAVMGLALTAIILIFNLPTIWGCALAVFFAIFVDELLKKIKWFK
jgi:hypothetical protein